MSVLMDGSTDSSATKKEHKDDKNTNAEKKYGKINTEEIRIKQRKMIERHTT